MADFCLDLCACEGRYHFGSVIEEGSSIAACVRLLVNGRCDGESVRLDTHISRMDIGVLEFRVTEHYSSKEFKLPRFTMLHVDLRH